jgi:hypothetical protein
MSVALVVVVVCGLLGAIIAQHKNLKPLQWVVACAFLGPIGVLLALIAKPRPR